MYFCLFPQIYPNVSMYLNLFCQCFFWSLFLHDTSVVTVMNRHWSAAVHILESRTMNIAARDCWIYLSAHWLLFPHVYPNQTPSSWILMLWISATHSKPSVWKTREPTTNTKTRRLCLCLCGWIQRVTTSEHLVYEPLSTEVGGQTFLTKPFFFMHSCSVSKTSLIGLSYKCQPFKRNNIIHWY